MQWLPWNRLMQLPRQIKILLVVLLAGLLVLAGFVLIRKLQQKKAYQIGIILSRTEVSEADWQAITYMVDRRLESLNREGGINGRPLQALYLDDEGHTGKLVQLVTQAVQNQDLIALAGAEGIARALALGPLLTREKVPYVGQYIYTRFTKAYPTMFSAGLGETEGNRLFAELLRTKAGKVGFIGQENSVQSATFLKGIQLLESGQQGFSLAYQQSFPAGHRFTSPELKALADTLQQQQVDFLVFANEVKSLYSVLEALATYQVQLPVYCGLIDIAQLDTENPYVKAAELYDLNSLGIPGTHHKRLQENLLSGKNGYSGGAAAYQLGLGGNLADVIGLIAEAAGNSGSASGTSVRSAIRRGLQHYISGRRIFRGWTTDLYFTPDRAFAGNILIAWKPRNLSLPVLAPVQYLLKDTSLQPAQVLYTNLDMVRIEQVNDEEGTFLATFYLQLQSEQKVEITQLDFTNAVRNAINYEPLLEARLIRTRKDTSGFGFYHYLYKVSGKFRFEADLHRYPLDEQHFPVSIQTSNALQPFYIQPAAPAHHDTVFEAKGWRYQNFFVGFDQEIISSSNALHVVRKNIPYYKFTFVYAMERSSIDYFLKTLIPLFTILTIAYFSVYIPPREFEALAAMQVTALLSCIALYFSTFKPQIQYATTSDKIFIFSYVMVTSLIGTSILLYLVHRRFHTLKKLAQVYQRVLFPLIVIGFSIYVRWL